ncbi:hypothetical protein PR202_ga26071 [Eleusine coracana subsp. coracana]|uniref:Uncharacterized protein n=1 Tax=Eleusine coracana subsp. coracana TaxID=191504 RepID=A0AAV5DCM9_ELECO|nr:hypothetical protein PR202_ga26071 [Eleusine coracana subsp. coracana]
MNHPLRDKMTHLHKSHMTNKIKEVTKIMVTIMVKLKMVRIKYASNALSEPSDEDSSASSPSKELVPASKRRKAAAVRGQGSSGQGSSRDAKTMHVQPGGSLPPRRAQDKGKRPIKDKRLAKEKPSKSSRAARADNVEVVEGLKVHELAYLEGYIYKDYKKDLDALVEARKKNSALCVREDPTRFSAATPARYGRRRFPNGLGLLIALAAAAAAFPSGGVFAGRGPPRRQGPAAGPALDRAGAYRGIAHCGTTVARAEGVRALWKGLTPFATHLTLKYALRLGSNAVLQSAFKDPTTGKVSAQGRLASGFGAGVIEALLIVTPFEARLLRISVTEFFSLSFLRCAC